MEKISDGFYYIGELKIPHTIDADLQRLTEEYVKKQPNGYYFFKKGSDWDFTYVEVWKMVGNWESAEGINYLSIWQIEDICKKKNVVFKYNK